MPRYIKDVKRDLPADEVADMIGRCTMPAHGAAIAILYITGARPAEALMLERKDFAASADDLSIQIRTLKRGLDRTLTFSRNATPFVEYIIGYVAKLPDGRIFPFRNGSTLRKIVYRASLGLCTPYSFRHNRLYRLGQMADIFEIAAWKGARDLNSVLPYAVKGGVMTRRFKDRIR